MILALLAAAAQPMTAGQFLDRAEPLMNKSKAALLFSSDARTLLKAIGAAAGETRAKLDAERAAGRAVATCLPPKGKASVDPRELVAYLRTLSPPQRAQSFNQAFAGYAARKYPCR